MEIRTIIKLMMCAIALISFTAYMILMTKNDNRKHIAFIIEILAVLIEWVV